jgi:hypothetical protein
MKVSLSIRTPAKRVHETPKAKEGKEKITRTVSVCSWADKNTSAEFEVDPTVGFMCLIENDFRGTDSVCTGRRLDLAQIEIDHGLIGHQLLRGALQHDLSAFHDITVR